MFEERGESADIWAQSSSCVELCWGGEAPWRQDEEDDEDENEGGKIEMDDEEEEKGGGGLYKTNWEALWAFSGRPNGA